MCMQSINYACIKRTSKKYIVDENDTLNLRIFSIQCASKLIAISFLLDHDSKYTDFILK